jgi:hypothetical protein
MVSEILKPFSQGMLPVVACIFLPGDYHDPEAYKGIDLIGDTECSIL